MGGGRGSRAVSDGEDLCDDESDGTDSEAEGGSDASDDELDFETEEGDDGNGGAGGAEGLVVGDLLRIWWDQDEVWFRCKIVGLAGGGRIVKVDYLRTWSTIAGATMPLALTHAGAWPARRARRPPPPPRCSAAPPLPPCAREPARHEG